MILSFLMFSCFANPTEDQLSAIFMKVQALQEQKTKLDAAQKAAAEKVRELEGQLKQKGESVAQKQEAVAQMSKKILELQQQAKQSQSDSESSSKALNEAQEKLAAMQKDLAKEAAEHKAINVDHKAAKKELHIATTAHVEHAKIIGDIHKAVTAPHSSVAVRRTHSPQPKRGLGLGHHVNTAK